MCTSRLSNSLWAATVLFASLSLAAEPAPTKPSSDKQVPTDIRSQKMTVRNQESKAIFEGSVVLTKGALVVHSDTMVVLFKQGDQVQPGKAEANGKEHKARVETGGDKSKTGGAGDLPVISNRSVSQIEALGRVLIEKAESRATCSKAIYYHDEDKIVLTGNPIAWQKGAKVTGKRITMYLAEDRSVVEGESRVLIRPEGKEGGE
jgi:lipopolysaccharide export system protein LptA